MALYRCRKCNFLFNTTIWRYYVTKRICDICGNEVRASGWYTLRYICILRVEKIDICLSCLEEIKKKKCSKK